MYHYVIRRLLFCPILCETLWVPRRFHEQMMNLQSKIRPANIVRNGLQLCTRKLFRKPYILIDNAFKWRYIIQVTRDVVFNHCLDIFFKTEILMNLCKLLYDKCISIYLETIPLLRFVHVFISAFNLNYLFLHSFHFSDVQSHGVRRISW